MMLTLVTYVTLWEAAGPQLAWLGHFSPWRNNPSRAKVNHHALNCGELSVTLALHFPPHSPGWGAKLHPGWKGLWNFRSGLHIRWFYTHRTKYRLTPPYRNFGKCDMVRYSVVVDCGTGHEHHCPIWSLQSIIPKSYFMSNICRPRIQRSGCLVYKYTNQVSTWFWAHCDSSSYAMIST